VLDERATFVPSGDMEALILAAQAAQRPAPAPPAWTWEDAAHMTWRVYEQAIAQVDAPITARQGRRRRATREGDQALTAPKQAEPFPQ
jgi:hypothetical protein